MSFALKELTRLLTADAPTIGAVITVEAGLVRVATERGAVTTRTLDVLAIGDRVLIKNGMASKAPIARQTYPV